MSIMYKVSPARPLSLHIVLYISEVSVRIALQFLLPPRLKVRLYGQI